MRECADRARVQDGVVPVLPFTERTGRGEPPLRLGMAAPWVRRGVAGSGRAGLYPNTAGAVSFTAQAAQAQWQKFYDSTARTFVHPAYHL